jgi:hypothetical protein
LQFEKKLELYLPVLPSISPEILRLSTGSRQVEGKEDLLIAVLLTSFPIYIVPVADTWFNWLKN